MPFPKAQLQTLHAFGAAPDFRASDALWLESASRYFVGVQHGLVASDRAAWDERSGKWRGPSPLLAVARDLSVGGTKVLSSGGFDFERVAEGSALVANWAIGVSSVLGIGLQVEYPAIWAYALVDVATGAVTASGTHTQNTPAANTQAIIGALPSGSYALWTHISAAYQEPLTPAQYQTLTGHAVPDSAFYTESTARFFWDITLNIGRKPSDPDHPLYAARLALEAAGTTDDRPELAMFVTGALPQQGEWSCLLIQSGSGTWASGATTLPHPGAALLRDPDGRGSSALESIAFDYLARRVTASKVLSRDCLNEAGAVVLPAGTALISGERASPGGPEMALWAYLSGAWTLVGKSEVHSTGVCECSLQAFHTTTDIAQFRDGRVLLINRCSKHLLAPDGARLGDRLPPFPLSLDGHPGGHALSIVDGVPHWMTESFLQNQDSAFEIGQFYNTHESLEGITARSGVGGAFHGDNCATLWRGAYWTIVQEPKDTGEAARQFLARWSGTRWDTFGRPSWRASDYRIQRLASIGGNLFGCGYVPATGRGIAWRIDDSTLQWMQFPYRTDRLATVERDGREEVLAIAQSVTADNPNLSALPYSVLRLTGEVRTVLFFYNPAVGTVGGYCATLDSLAASGVTTAELPAYYRWDAPSFSWIESTLQPAQPYLQKVIGATTVCYIMFGTWPYDPTIWSVLEWKDGTGFALPLPGAQNASEALALMPTGTRYQTIFAELQRDWWAAQIDDSQSEQYLRKVLSVYPSLWISLDGTGDGSDLTQYDVLVRRCNWRQSLPRLAQQRVRACFLWPPTIEGAAYFVREYALSPRD